MPTSTLCTNLRTSLETIRALKTDFDAAYEAAISSGTPAEIQKAQDLKQALETRTRELQQEVNVLETERVYDLRAQYESQVTLLKRTGLIETRIFIETGEETEEFFMRDLHEHDYPVPSYETIVEHLVERKEFLASKADQGFTKFLLVPFGMSLDQMIQRFRAFLLDYKKDHPEFGRHDPAKRDDSDKPDWDPIWVWEGYDNADVKGTLVYDPQSFDEEDHNGLTKTEILERQKTDQDPMFGWRFLFLQAGRDGNGFKVIPRNGQGETQGEQVPRGDLEAGKSSKEYLADQLRTSQDPTSPYYGESGMAPEEWMVMFMSYLQETGRPLDNYQNDTDSIVFLTGTYFIASGNVPYACWYRGIRQVDLGGNGPGDVSEYTSARGAVRG
ncbi:hypothetical protein HYV70_01430 [Candidatus Uhrbacteria bacterium]|nr:hypothetical protein [Candidatus Uhrbacteria bacterium]